MCSRDLNTRSKYIAAHFFSSFFILLRSFLTFLDSNSDIFFTARQTVGDMLICDQYVPVFLKRTSFVLTASMETLPSRFPCLDPLFLPSFFQLQHSAFNTLYRMYPFHFCAPMHSYFLFFIRCFTAFAGNFFLRSILQLPHDSRTEAWKDERNCSFVRRTLWIACCFFLICRRGLYIFKSEIEEVLWSLGLFLSAD